MSKELVKPGDTIEITCNFDNWKGKRYVVVGCPESRKGSYDDEPSNAWVLVEGDQKPSYFLSCNYKIIARGNGHTLTNSEIDRSLDKQRDNNLKGVFA